jgi:catalase
MNGVFTNSRDGFMTVNGNGGSNMNYEPNSHGTGPFEDKSKKTKPVAVSGGFMGR